MPSKAASMSEHVRVPYVAIRDVTDWKIRATLAIFRRMVSGKRGITERRVRLLQRAFVVQNLGMLNVEVHYASQYHHVTLALMLRGVVACDLVWGDGKGPTSAIPRKRIQGETTVAEDNNPFDQVVLAWLPMHLAYAMPSSPYTISSSTTYVSF